MTTSCIVACAATFRSALMGEIRARSSAVAFTNTTAATLGQAGTTIAAAKYGTKPNEPRADLGNKYPRISAAIASPQSISASANVDWETAGACEYATMPH